MRGIFEGYEGRTVRELGGYGPAGHLTLTRVALQLLSVYSFLKRAVSSKLRPGVGRMRSVRSAFYSSMWRYAAKAIEAQFIASPGGRAEITDGDRILRVCENRTSIDDPIVVARAADKLAVHDLLARAGIAVTRQTVVDTSEVDKALRVLRDAKSGVVVKPASNTGAGAGVSTCVRTSRELLVAMAWARAYCRRILIEEQILGDCYRVLVMDGEVLDIVVRHRPTVTGDGTSTLRDLVRRENGLRRRLGAARAQVLIRIDQELCNTIRSQGLTLKSQPREGEVVVLKHVVNDNGAVENLSANGRLGGSVLASACAAARLVGTRLAGIDIICPNPGVCLESSGGAIIEVNANPGLYYHYRTTDVGFPVTEEVLRRYFS